MSHNAEAFRTEKQHLGKKLQFWTDTEPVHPPRELFKTAQLAHPLNIPFEEEALFSLQEELIVNTGLYYPLLLTVMENGHEVHVELYR